MLRLLHDFRRGTKEGGFLSILSPQLLAEKSRNVLLVVRRSMTCQGLNESLHDVRDGMHEVVHHGDGRRNQKAFFGMDGNLLLSLLGSLDVVVRQLAAPKDCSELLLSPLPVVVQVHGARQVLVKRITRETTQERVDGADFLDL